MFGTAFAIFLIEKGVNKNVGVDKNLIAHVAHPE